MSSLASLQPKMHTLGPSSWYRLQVHHELRSVFNAAIAKWGCIPEIGEQCIPVRREAIDAEVREVLVEARLEQLHEGKRQQCSLEAVREFLLDSFLLEHSSSFVEIPSRPAGCLMKRTSGFVDEVGILQKLVNGWDSLKALRSHLQIKSEGRRAPARR